MSAENNERQSLLDLFCSPDEKRIGVFGLLCALSADEQFVDSILDRFSGLLKNQRMHSGHISMALFLDPHNKPITSLPGLCWAYPEERKWEGKTKLQHAKVALLGFGESVKEPPDYYRLIVFTGNWTSEAVNISINLVWYCDYDTTSSENQKQEASDICKAVDFWWKLLGNDGSGGYYRIAIRERITKFLDVISENVIPPNRGYPPRFISNILDAKAKKDGVFVDNSIGAQFIKFVVENGMRHNFICCGSGFFEQADEKHLLKEPEVIKGIVEVLKDKDRLAKNVTNISKWLVINPKTSGAVGEWIKNTQDSDLTWSLCQPKHPDKEDDISFHAKYIFIANKRNDSYSNGLLYLGSGNLSYQGFALGPGTNGNIEAGVFLAVNDSIKEKDLCKKLGIYTDSWLDKSLIKENPDGEELEQESAEIQLSPPIISCVWNRETQLLKWDWDDPDAGWEAITINNLLIHSDQKEMRLEEGDVNSFKIKLTAKREGKPKEYVWDILVLNENGDFYSPPAQLKSMPEILDEIRNFPAVYEDEEENVDDLMDECQAGGIPNHTVEDFSELRNQYKDSPLHSATALVETIAEQNQQVHPKQMQEWIAHLKRTLIEGMKKETINELQSLDRNFLDPLKEEKGFAPDEPTEKYKEFIEEVVDKWGLKNAKLLVEKKECSDGLA